MSDENKTHLCLKCQNGIHTSHDVSVHALGCQESGCDCLDESWRNKPQSAREWLLNRILMHSETLNLPETLEAYAAHCRQQDAARIAGLLKENYRLTSAMWSEVCSCDLFQDLKHGKYRHILELLQNGDISIGKAAQSIAELSHGVTPNLPSDYLDYKEPEEALEVALQRAEAAEAKVASLEKEVAERTNIIVLLEDEEGYFWDSLGVPGSGFSVCKLCGEASAPGGAQPLVHKPDCLLNQENVKRISAEYWENQKEAHDDAKTLCKRVATAEARVKELEQTNSIPE